MLNRNVRVLERDNLAWPVAFSVAHILSLISLFALLCVCVCMCVGLSVSFFYCGSFSVAVYCVALSRSRVSVALSEFVLSE